MMGLLRSVPAVVAVLFAAFIYNRSNVISTFYLNHPSRFQSINSLRGFEVRFADSIRNCEDAYLNDKHGWALLSCDPGRDEWNTVLGHFINPEAPPKTGLYLYQYAEAQDSVPEKLDLGLSEEQRKDFHPLGVDYHEPTQTLFVVNHARTHCRIELYKLDVTTGTAQSVRSFEHPELAAPNSLAIINEREFLVTNDHHFLARENLALAQLESYSGIPGGAVKYVKLREDGEVEVKSLARVAFANGIAFLNATTVAVAGSTILAVKLYKIDYDSEGAGTAPRLSWVSTIPLPFMPDNLSVDGDGKLLISGHPHAPSLEKVSTNNRLCQGSQNASEPHCQFDRLSWVAEWSEQGGVQTVYAGAEYGFSTTALRDVTRGLGLVVGLYEKGVLAWKA